MLTTIPKDTYSIFDLYNNKRELVDLFRKSRNLKENRIFFSCNKLWNIGKLFPRFSKKTKNYFLWDFGASFVARFSPRQVHIQITQKTPCLV